MMCFSCLINMIRFLLCRVRHIRWVPGTKKFRASEAKPLRVAMHQWLPRELWNVTASPELVTAICTSYNIWRWPCLNLIVQVRFKIRSVGRTPLCYLQFYQVRASCERLVVQGSYQHGQKFQGAAEMWKCAEITCPLTGSPSLSSF